MVDSSQGKVAGESSVSAGVAGSVYKSSYPQDSDVKQVVGPEHEQSHTSLSTVRGVSIGALSLASTAFSARKVRDSKRFLVCAGLTKSSRVTTHRFFESAVVHGVCENFWVKAKRASLDKLYLRQGIKHRISLVQRAFVQGEVSSVLDVYQNELIAATNRRIRIKSGIIVWNGTIKQTLTLVVWIKQLKCKSLWAGKYGNFAEEGGSPYSKSLNFSEMEFGNQSHGILLLTTVRTGCFRLTKHYIQSGCLSNAIRQKGIGRKQYIPEDEHFLMQCVRYKDLQVGRMEKRIADAASEECLDDVHKCQTLIKLLEGEKDALDRECLVDIGLTAKYSVTASDRSLSFVENLGDNQTLSGI